MKRMQLIKDLLQEHNFLVKIDLKATYFGIPLDKSSRKYIRFQWERKLYKFLCSYLGLGPVPPAKTSEDPNCLIKEDRCKNKNILGDILVMANVEKKFASKGYIDFSVNKSRFCDKFEKVATNTIEGH